MSRSSTSSSRGSADDRSDGSADGLIASPEDLGEQAVVRWLALPVILWFLTALVTTSAVDTIAPLPVPELEGMEGEQEARRRAAAKLLDGTLAQLVERDLQIRSRVRRVLGQPYTLALFRYLGEASGSAVAGDDHTLFLRSRAVPPDAPDEEFWLGTACAVTALERRLAVEGVELLTVPLPRKAVVMQDWLPAWLDPRRAIDVELIAELQRRGVPTVDLLEAWSSAEPAELYHPVGTHWTELAEVLAARATAAAIGGGIAADVELREDGTDASEPGLLQWIGIARDVEREYLQSIQVPTWNAYRADEPLEKTFADDALVALAGTSFSARRQFPWFVSTLLGEPVDNGALVGGDPFESALGVLLRRDVPPELIVLEVPVHTLFTNPPARDAGQLFVDLGPIPGVAVRELERPDALPGDVVRIGESRLRVGSLRVSSLYHSGDGAAWLRLSARVEQPVRVHVDCGGFRVQAAWRPGVDELTLPIVALGAGHPAVFVSLVGEAGRTLEGLRVELLRPFDPALAVELGVQEAGPGRLALALDGEEISTGGVLWIDFDESGRLAPEVVVTAETASGPVRLATIENLRGDGTAALGLGGLRGRTVRRVVIESGEEPISIAGAYLLRPAAGSALEDR